MDIMDGHFVPNLTGPPVVAHLMRGAEALLDYLSCRPRRADRRPRRRQLVGNLSLRGDGGRRRVRLLAGKIRWPHSGRRARPASDQSVYPSDASLPRWTWSCASVEPGFGGQKFNPEVCAKVRTPRRRRPTSTFRWRAVSGPAAQPPGGSERAGGRERGVRS